VVTVGLFSWWRGPDPLAQRRDALAGQVVKGARAPVNVVDSTPEGMITRCTRTSVPVIDAAR
jgi:hypothetical protein